VAVFAGGTRARTLAFLFRDRITDNTEWDVIGTPCEDVVRGNLCHYPAGVNQRFPEDKLIVEWGIESYLGVPLRDAQGRHLGHLAVFDERPMPAEPRNLLTFRILAARAAAELERLQYETQLRESEERFRLLAQSIPQKIFTADANGHVDYFNQPWTEFTGISFDQIKGTTCSTSPRSRPASRSWTRPTSRCGLPSGIPCGLWPCAPTRRDWSSFTR
jgi:formate hydrogenlyase transcriptional activator